MQRVGVFTDIHTTFLQDMPCQFNAGHARNELHITPTEFIGHTAGNEQIQERLTVHAAEQHRILNRGTQAFHSIVQVHFIVGADHRSSSLLE